MRKLVVSLIAPVLALGVFAFPAARPTHAQEATSGVVCDSTLMLLLYIAEHDYGFQSTMDVTTFDKGQFTHWFDAHMSAQEAAGTEGEIDATTDAGEAGTGGEVVATAEAGDMGETPVTVLVPGVVAGEAVECTQLRSELENFFFNEINNLITGAAG